MFDNDLKFIPTEIFQITNKDETDKPLFKVNTTTLGSEKNDINDKKDIEIQPLNEFIIKRNDDSATTPNVVNITDDIVALQTSIFDLTASDKITIKSPTAGATGEIKIDSSNKIILVSEDDIDINTKTTMKINRKKHLLYWIQPVQLIKKCLKLIILSNIVRSVEQISEQYI